MYITLLKIRDKIVEKKYEKMPHVHNRFLIDPHQAKWPTNSLLKIIGEYSIFTMPSLSLTPKGERHKL